ncbi:hypothetical protein [Lutibaculum baratangense]|uniref:Uncharacterized protein n=1 Tax=Lutibaculum baratangense AMV1 TaxID=631454 RepID=V4R8V8_9HYPH|nr:hypothetical protein [Lutibaculum baratangense]ESR22621.1 hypothetical protein N177_3757 [Lutibaculum baratangense AMV1]
MIDARTLVIAAVATLAVVGLDFGIGHSAAFDEARPAKDQSRVVGHTTTTDPNAPQSSGSVTVVGQAKADRLSAAPSCAARGWPYLPEACLVTADGRAPRTAVRTLTIEERSAAGSSLVRLPVTQIVSQ